MNQFTSELNFHFANSLVVFSQSWLAVSYMFCCMSRCKSQNKCFYNNFFKLENPAIRLDMKFESHILWLGVEPLLLSVERSQLGWFGHLIRMPPGRLPWEVFQARPTGRRPRGTPRTRWRDYVSRLACERLRIPQNELENVAGEREVWVSRLGLLHPRPDPGLSGWEWMDGWILWAT